MAYAGVTYAGATYGGTRLAAAVPSQTRTLQGAAPSFASDGFSVSVTVLMGNAASSFAAGQPRTQYIINLAGFSAAAIGQPTWSQQQNVFPLATDPSFVGGLFRTSVTVPMAAGVSEETFGRPPPLAQRMRPLLAVASAEGVGQPRVGPSRQMMGAPTAEAMGQPVAVPGPVTVYMLGEILTVFGRPSIGLTVLLGSATSLEAVSNFSAVRSQTHTLQGAAPSEAFGLPSLPVLMQGAASGAAFGQPLTNLARTISMQGGAPAEQVPGPIVGAAYPVEGIGSAENFGNPQPPAQAVHPEGTASSFVGGQFTFFVPPSDQTLDLQGKASDLAFGVFHTIIATIAPESIVSEFDSGLFHTSVTVLMGGAPSGAVLPGPIVGRTYFMWPADSAEAVGQPNFPSPQTVLMGSVASGETIGAWNWTAGRIGYPLGAPTGEHFSEFTYVTGPASRQMQGLASAEAFGPVHYPQTVAVSSIAPTDAYGLPSTPQSASPRSITSAEAVGRPARPAAGVAFRTMQGIASAEAVSGVLIPIGMVGVGSSEAFGQPHVGASVSIRGAVSAEAAGRPKIELPVQPVGVGTSGAFGRPAVHYSVPILGTDSGEAFGEPNVGLFLIINLEGAPSSSSVAQPRVTSHNDLFPTAVDSSESSGSPQIQLTFNARLQGAPPDEAFGLWRAQLEPFIIRPAGISEWAFEPHATHDKYGEPLVSSWILGATLAGIPSAEAAGRPAQAVHVIRPQGAASSEAFGRPIAPPQTIHLGSVPTSERVSRFALHAATGRGMVGIPSAEQVGRPTVPSQTVHPAGLSGGNVGVPRVNVTVLPRGIQGGAVLGLPTTVQTVSVAELASSSAFGFPRQPAQTRRVATVPSAAAMGQFGLQLTVPMGSAGAGETFGAPQLAVYLAVRPGPVAPGETWGGPVVSTVVGIRLGGASSASSFGQPYVALLVVVAVAGADSAEVLGLVAFGQFPTTGVWIDTALSTVAQMLDLTGRSMSVQVLAVDIGVSYEGNLGAPGALLLGGTLPVGAEPQHIVPGEGVGVRYIGARDIDPAQTVFVVDGDTKPLSELVFYHEDTGLTGGPWTDLDIIWMTPNNFPGGSHTATVTAVDIDGRTDTKSWQFTSDPP